MIYSITLNIPELPKMPNELLGAHWRTRSKHAKKWREIIFAYTAGKRPIAPLQKAQVTLTRHSSREPDTDGCRGSFKAILDALVHNGVLMDDKPANVGEPIVKWEKSAPKMGKITVTVTEVIEVST